MDVAGGIGLRELLPLPREMRLYCGLIILNFVRDRVSEPIESTQVSDTLRRRVI